MRGKHVKYKWGWQALHITLALLAAAMLLYPFLEPYTLEVENTELVCPDLPEDIGQLRIAYLSDFDQAGFPWLNAARTKSIISTVNSLKPDLVLLGGDFVQRAEKLSDFFRDMPNIHSNYGVLAVLGERDQGEEALPPDLVNTMKAAGVTLLQNTVLPVRIGQRSVYIAGADALTGGSAALRALAAGVSREDFVILLCHTPEIIDDALSLQDKAGRNGWFDLGLFGHTNGGQLPMGSRLLRIAEEIPANHQRGWVQENRTPMLITRGLGTVKLPIRIGCSPQIHLITVRRVSARSDR